MNGKSDSIIVLIERERELALIRQECLKRES